MAVSCGELSSGLLSAVTRCTTGTVVLLNVVDSEESLEYEYRSKAQQPTNLR